VPLFCIILSMIDLTTYFDYTTFVKIDNKRRQ